MSLDPKLLNQARKIHADEKQKRQGAAMARQAEVFAKIPQLAEVDLALRQTVFDTIQVALGQSKVNLAEIGEKNQALQAQLQELLVRHAYPADYLENPPTCCICKDSFHDNTEICPCLLATYRRLQGEELSSLLNLGEGRFENFQLDFYGEHRPRMAVIFDICKTYAQEFGPHSGNLFFVGQTGLGKTFLSTCIAKTVVEKGHSVVYAPAGELFAQFEREKFGKGDDLEKTQEEVARYFNCDLLILDDLGTEMTTSFVVSALYTLVNTRLLRKKQTIINTNYSSESLGEKYNPQILSRLEGEYTKLSFFGEDIRLQKKKQMEKMLFDAKQ